VSETTDTSAKPSPGVRAEPQAFAIRGRDGPRAEDISRCVHCGFCLNYCPTYLELGLETESPRGRIHLIGALSEGRIQPTSSVIAHLDLCVQCRACETACPSGVPYARIMEGARSQIQSLRRGRPFAWRLRSFMLRTLLPHPRRLRLLARLLRLYQRRLQGPLQGTGLLRLLPARVREAQSLLPRLPDRFFEPTGMMAAGRTDPPARSVALLTGCVMPLTYPQTHEATVRVLARNNCRVVAPPEQVCCGSLFLHNGDREAARRLARRNIDVFLRLGVDAVVVNAAGCGATMKEYGELLRDDPEYAEKAERFSSMVRDVTEFIAELPWQDGLGPVPARVTYQDSCHVAHGQGITAQPRAILQSIPELEFVEMEGADRCCGSGGIYNVTQQEMANRLLESKMRDIRATRAQVIASTNPGCMLQIEAGLRRTGTDGRSVHVVELLDESYQAGDRARGRSEEGE
jgi:glycolate oxidase iron-sulfur subunit